MAHLHKTALPKTRLLFIQMLTQCLEGGTLLQNCKIIFIPEGKPAAKIFKFEITPSCLNPISAIFMSYLAPCTNPYFLMFQSVVYTQLNDI